MQRSSKSDGPAHVQPRPITSASWRSCAGQQRQESAACVGSCEWHPEPCENARQKAPMHPNIAHHQWLHGARPSARAAQIKPASGDTASTGILPSHLLPLQHSRLCSPIPNDCLHWERITKDVKPASVLVCAATVHAQAPNRGRTKTCCRFDQPTTRTKHPTLASTMERFDAMARTTMKSRCRDVIKKLQPKRLRTHFSRESRRNVLLNQICVVNYC